MLQQYDERNKNILININGQLVHRDEARISPFDSAVQGGDAVWEGLRLYNGRIFRLQRHLDRLVASAQAMAFADIPDQKSLRQELKKTLDANNMSDGVHIRLTLTRGEKITSGMDPRLNTMGATLIIIAEHKAPVYGDKGVNLMTSAVRRIPPDCVDQNIHSCNLINSILAKIQANAAGVDDALMLDTRGFVAETNATHVFLVYNNEVYTSTTGYCPEGVTREAVLALCDQHGITTRIGDISLTECYRSDEMFCTGTMGELVPIMQLDGRTIGAGEAGPMTRRLSDLYRQLVMADGEDVVAGSIRV